MNLGDYSSLAVPIVGSDLTTGYSPTTMHMNPAPQSAPVVVVAPAPASSAVPWLLLLALAGVAWYGYKQGWFDGLFESEPESSMTIERRAA